MVRNFSWLCPITLLEEWPTFQCYNTCQKLEWLFHSFPNQNNRKSKNHWCLWATCLLTIIKSNIITIITMGIITMGIFLNKDTFELQWIWFFIIWYWKIIKRLNKVGPVHYTFLILFMNKSFILRKTLFCLCLALKFPENILHSFMNWPSMLI